MKEDIRALQTLMPGFFKWHLQPNGQVKVLKAHQINLRRAMEALADELDQEFAQVVLGRIELVVADLLAYNESSQAWEESDLHGTIENLAEECGDIELFIALNCMLPAEKEVLLNDARFGVYKDLMEIDDDDTSKKQYRELMELFEDSCRDKYGDQFLGEARKTNPKYFDELQRTRKGWLIRFLFGEKYRQKVTVFGDHEGDRPPRFVFCPSVTSNGKELHLLAFDLKEAKSKKRSGPLQGSLLERAELARRTTKFKLDEFTGLKSTRGTWYVGIDLGQRFMAGVGAIRGAGCKRQVRSLEVKASAVREPQRLYRHWIKSAKDAYHSTAPGNLSSQDQVYYLERQLEPKVVPGSGSSMINESWNEYMARFVNAFRELAQFYNSNGMKRKKWDLKKALRGEYDRVINAILRMVDKDISKKCKNDDVVFAIGDSEFSYGDQEDHKSFKKYLYKKLKSLGYRVYGVKEDWTSQMCPRPDCHQKCTYASMRVKYCEHCYIYYHRDAMAGENIAVVLITMCKRGDKNARPKYLSKRTLMRAENPSEQVTGS